MGMGHYPQFADIISEEFVKEICPNEFNDFVTLLKENDVSIYDVIAYLNDDIDIDFIEDKILNQIVECYDHLCSCFTDKTELQLFLVYNVKEDDGDELDGYAWAVEGVYVYSEAGAKYQDKIERKFWNNWG